MPIMIGNKRISKIYLGTKRIKKVYKGETLIWSDVVDTPITLTKGYVGSEQAWPYSIDATLYSGIDMGLYKGIQFYISLAYISANFVNTMARIYVVAGNKNIEIAGSHNNGSGTNNSSLAKTTQTILFNDNSGMTNFRIVGEGPTTCKYYYELYNAVLLAR